MSDENAKLIADDSKKSAEEVAELSVGRQRLILAALILLQFISLCTDTFIIPFFPQVAMTKGLKKTEIGVVLSCFDFTRFISSPFYGSMVSEIILSTWL